MTGFSDDYRVQLEAYAGPLDLLLHLVKRHEIDLHDIPVAQLTDQYLAHLRLIRSMDMDQAGEFLVMAATLLEIKSKMIQPQSEDEADEGETSDQTGTDAAEDALDPRYELVQQLLAYKQYKDAANYLEQRGESWASRFEVSATQKKPQNEQAGEADDEPGSAPRLDLELEDVNVLDLCEAFGRILDSIGQREGHQVTYDDTPIALHAEDIADRLNREGPLTLGKLCEGRTRAEMIGVFLATLELVRDRRVKVHQHEVASEVAIELVSEQERQQMAEQEDKPADWTDPETGEVQYDWPDEEGRRRAEKRKKIREKQRLKQMRGESVSDDDGDDDDDNDEGDEEELLDDETE